MPRTMQNTVEIDAPPQQVWGVLVDFGTRPAWDPYYRQIRGEARVGARLRVLASLRDGERLIASRPRIVRLEPGRCLVWTNRFFLPGLLDSTNEFHLSSSRTGATVLHQTETFSGALPALTRGTLDAVEARLGQWAAALKRRVEADGGPG